MKKNKQSRFNQLLYRNISSFFSLYFNDIVHDYDEKTIQVAFFSKGVGVVSKLLKELRYIGDFVSFNDDTVRMIRIFLHFYSTRTDAGSLYIVTNSYEEFIISNIMKVQDNSDVEGESFLVHGDQIFNEMKFDRYAVFPTEEKAAETFAYFAKNIVFILSRIRKLEKHITNLLSSSDNFERLFISENKKYLYTMPSFVNRKDIFEGHVYLLRDKLLFPDKRPNELDKYFK